MRMLIDRHCLQGILSNSILSDLKEKGCFVRPYLGCCQPQDIQLKPEHQTYPQVDVPLQVSQMEKLGVSDAHIKQYACTMAEALAILRWIGRIDGKGVEYVLAPPWSEITINDTISNRLGDHCMWLLDFDICEEQMKSSNLLSPRPQAPFRNMNYEDLVQKVLAFKPPRWYGSYTSYMSYRSSDFHDCPDASFASLFATLKVPLEGLSLQGFIG